jgi:light-harvesting complex II chlorophyll a/b binding protein 4
MCKDAHTHAVPLDGIRPLDATHGPSGQTCEDMGFVETGDALWLPNTERPAWLDGSLPGDRGFDPLGLAKPTEYLQVSSVVALHIPAFCMASWKRAEHRACQLSCVCGERHFRVPAAGLQVDLDSLDQNKAVNKAGNIVGKFAAPKSKITDTALQPYDEVFGLQRFRETELIHGRQAPASCSCACIAAQHPRGAAL